MGLQRVDESHGSVNLPTSLIDCPADSYVHFPVREQRSPRPTAPHPRVPRERASRNGKLAAAPEGRIESLDLFRGLAILAVVLIHVSGHFLRVVPMASPPWSTLAIFHQSLQFAVPGFLFLSAFLNGRHLMQGYSLVRYARSRLGRALWPYLLWSAVGMFFLQEFHIQPVTSSDILPMLVWGQGFYHLYFLVVLLQLFFLLPLLILPFGVRPRFVFVVIGAVVLQLAFYIINRYYYQMLNVGSLLSWYVIPVMLGLWMASQSHRLNEILRKGFPAALIVTVVSFAIYSPLATQEMLDLPTDTFRYQVTEWTYTASASFLLLALTRLLPIGRAAPWLKYCGVFSFQIYLLHPFVMKALDGIWWPVSAEHLGVGMIGYAAACLIIPFLIAQAAVKGRISRVLFGS